MKLKFLNGDQQWKWCCFIILYIFVFAIIFLYQCVYIKKSEIQELKQKLDKELQELKKIFEQQQQKSNEYKIKATKALNELFDQEYTNQNKKDNQMY